LGLSIVRHMVELHGGTVEVDSPGEGQGATFSVQLPIRAELTAALPSADSARQSLWNPVLLEGVRVLVVEDEVDTRDLLVTALEQCGAAVTAVATSPEALDAFEASGTVPDVLVSDIGLPGEDGYELLRKVRSLATGRGGDVPAAALTAFARAEDRLRALEAGFQTHLAKPIDPSELVATVARLAGRGM
ncbi:response regulator, partial [bacterium]